MIIDYSAASPGLLAQYCRFRTARPPIVVFSVPDNLNVALALLEAGATAYLGEDSSATELYETVLAVIENNILIPSTLASALIERLRERSGMYAAQTFHCLTARELQVAELMGNHLSNKQIASALGISIHTVKIHVHHVIQKLALDRRSEARDALSGVGLSSGHL
jgi:DNA-binding NarL/FixJ family response regulator